MYTVLSPQRLSLDLDQDSMVRAARAGGYDGVEPLLDHFADSSDEADRVTELVREAGLRWGPAALPTTIGPETSESGFGAIVDALRQAAPRLARAEVTTLSTWIAPAGDRLAYSDALRFYRERLTVLLPILRDHGLRLSMEYVGPPTWRVPHRYDFVHSYQGMRELLDGLSDPGAFGVTLDSFHWYAGGETAQDIAVAHDILVVDLNDAIPGVPAAEQLDLQRAQPGATGVIDLDVFLAAVRATGFSGPVHSEVMSDSLDHQPPEQRIAEAGLALRRTLAQQV